MENEKLVFRYTWNHMEVIILIRATILAVSKSFRNIAGAFAASCIRLFQTIR